MLEFVTNYLQIYSYFPLKILFSRYLNLNLLIKVIKVLSFLYKLVKKSLIIIKVDKYLHIPKKQN